MYIVMKLTPNDDTAAEPSTAKLVGRKTMINAFIVIRDILQ